MDKSKLQSELLGVIKQIVQNENTKNLRKSIKQVDYKIIKTKNTFILLLPMALFVTSICTLQGTVQVNQYIVLLLSTLIFVFSSCGGHVGSAYCYLSYLSI